MWPSWGTAGTGTLCWGDGFRKCSTWLLLPPPLWHVQCYTTHTLVPCREGYLFRTGAKGAGYYRKDVVRRYCASAAACPPVAPAAASGKLITVDDSDAVQGQEPLLQGAGDPELEQQQPVRGGGGGDGDDEAGAVRYIQQLLQAPPSMHCVVAGQSKSGSSLLLFGSSLGPSDCRIRVWRLAQHPPGTAGPADGSDGDESPPPQPPQQGQGHLMPTATLHRTLCGHTAGVLALALSPDGGLLFSGSYDCTIRVWSTADWHCLRELKGHGGGVRALALAPDGAVLYSAAADNTIRVRAGRGRNPQTLGGAQACVPPAAVCVCFLLLLHPEPAFIQHNCPPSCHWWCRAAAGLEHAALGVPAHDAWPARGHHLARLPGAGALRHAAGQRIQWSLWGQHPQGKPWAGREKGGGGHGGAGGAAR